MSKQQPRVCSFDDSSELKDSLASYIMKSQNDAFQRHGNPKFRLAVSGGSLPSMLTSPHLLTNPDVKWGMWEIFFADERAVPKTHPDSNQGLLEKEFLSKIPGDTKPTIVGINESLLDDTQGLANAYAKELVDCFAPKNSVPVPAFDLILLGCGPDGHTCSLFPGHELLRENTAWVAPIEDSPKPPPRRITLTLPVVTHATKIAFVATGAGKRDVLKTIFEKPEEGLPCSLVNEMAGDKVVWFTDIQAVEGIQGLRKGKI